MLQVVKELSTGRLQRTRASLQSNTPEIFHVLGNIYLSKVQSWQRFLEHGGDDEGGALQDIEQSLMALKVLRRLVIAGYEHPNRVSDFVEFWILLRNHLEDFLTMVTANSESIASAVRTLIEKHLLQISKLHVEMARTHPAAFALLPDSVALVRAYWSLVSKFGETYGSRTAVTGQIGSSGDAEEDEKPLFEKLALRALLLIRACTRMVFNPVHTFKYQHAQDKDEKKRASESMKTDLLTEDYALELMETCVTRFFVFRQSDLRDWEEEPEEWEQREEGESDAWEFSIRSCSEKIFLDLMINYKELLVPRLLSVFYSVSCRAQHLDQWILLTVPSS